MTPDRLLEGLAGLELAAREGPRLTERLSCALPEECLQATLAHLEDDRKGRVTRSGRLGARFTTHSQKLAENTRSKQHETTAFPASRRGRLGRSGRDRGARRRLRR